MIYIDIFMIGILILVVCVLVLSGSSMLAIVLNSVALGIWIGKLFKDILDELD